MDALPYDPVELVARGGRIGAPGRTLTRSFAGEGEALRYVRALLARRARAVRRIGVGYRAAHHHRPV